MSLISIVWCDLALYFSAFSAVLVRPVMLANALMSGADDISGKTGRELFAEKVERIWMMAGKWDEEEGKENNLVDLLAADASFGLTKEQITKTLKPELYVGRAPRQVEVFLRDVVNPVLQANKDELGSTAEISV